MRSVVFCCCNPHSNRPSPLVIPVTFVLFARVRVVCEEYNTVFMYYYYFRFHAFTSCWFCKSAVCSRSVRYRALEMTAIIRHCFFSSSFLSPPPTSTSPPPPPSPHFPAHPILVILCWKFEPGLVGIIDRMSHYISRASIRPFVSQPRWLHAARFSVACLQNIFISKVDVPPL